MNEREVLGNAIGEESTDDNDDNAVLFNSKKGTREEHVKAKEIAKKKGLCTICFKNHTYKDCPQREETEAESRSTNCLKESHGRTTMEPGHFLIEKLSKTNPKIRPVIQ